MSKPTGGKVGRPPRPPTPAAIPRAPRPADPIAAVLWDIEGEASKEKPNATKAGLFRVQYEALTRAQDRADGIANDQQRIDLEAALVSIDEWETWGEESEATILTLEQERDKLQQSVTELESKITSTIAAAANDRATYLALCPACAAATVTISGLRETIDAQRLLIEDCAAGMCPSSVTRQAEIDRTSSPAAQWKSWDAAVKEIEDERNRVIAARAHRVKVLAKVAEINARPKLTEAELAAMGSMAFDSSIRWGSEGDRKFLADNAEIIAEDTAAKAKAAAEREHQRWIELREQFGHTRMKVMLGAARYEEIFGPDPEE